jgi:5-deoxy-glucuronate isomerase
MKSNEEFGYPAFNQGIMPLTNTHNLYPNMLMDIRVLQVQKNETVSFQMQGEELAVLLIEGMAKFAWEGQEASAERKSCIDDPGYCLHVCQGVTVEVVALADNTEILMQSTKNDREFAPVFYTPSNTRRDTFGQGQFEGKALRTVTTFFDYESAPYSNMVCGEILIPQGGWSSYPPHEHPQPEVYYYRFGHPAGFGACFIDDNAYMIKDRSFAAIPGGKYHPQVNAPGYPMMYVWMIRHFDKYPWTERKVDPRHKWLLD